MSVIKLIYTSVLVRIIAAKFSSQLLPIVIAIWSFNVGQEDIITRLIVFVPMFCLISRLGIDDMAIVDKQATKSIKSAEIFLAPRVQMMCFLATSISLIALFIAFPGTEKHIALATFCLHLLTMSVATHFLMADKLILSILVRPLGVSIGCLWHLSGFAIPAAGMTIGVALIIWFVRITDSRKTKATDDNLKFNWYFFIYLITDSVLWNLLPLIDILSLKNGFESLILQRLIGIVATVLIIIFYNYLRQVAVFIKHNRNYLIGLTSLFYIFFEAVDVGSFNWSLPLMLFICVLLKYSDVYHGYFKNLIGQNIFIIGIFIICTIFFVGGTNIEFFVISNFIGSLTIYLITKSHERFSRDIV